jgi:hypothetical protein
MDTANLKSPSSVIKSAPVDIEDDLADALRDFLDARDILYNSSYLYAIAAKVQSLIDNGKLADDEPDIGFG